MKLSRSVILNDESGLVHTYWRCHNKEFYFKDKNSKNLYMNCLNETFQLPNTNYYGKVKIYGYCVMNNHFHKLVSYENGSQNLSNLMRRCNGKFGLIYNINNKRSGKVAESRPKTSLIQNSEHAMNVHMYIEANPLFTNKSSKKSILLRLKTLHQNKYCSYGFYAYGIETEHSKSLTIPDWYLELGSNSKIRQLRYRKLFMEYVLKSTNSEIRMFDFKLFIGSSSWVLNQKIRCKNHYLIEVLDLDS